MVDWSTETNKTKVSIIVPVYNSGATLRQCLDSLVNQTLKEIEIILINDGSTDDSGKVCAEYAKLHDCITYFNQENKGVSAARNLGLQIAAGTYLMFSDSDDYYEPDAAEILYKAAELHCADWVIGSVDKSVFDKREVVGIGSRVGIESVEIQSILLELTNNFMLNQLWGKLYRTDLIRRNHLLMREEMSCGEDKEWICRYVVHVRRIASVENITYHYIVNDVGSLSQRFDADYFDNIEKEYESIRKMYESLGMWEQHGK